ncbi:hypothetical protein [Mesorhizobium sp. M0847]|uniref:hypothetical protein n=1 Tax=unclassified Mesorhizobium TaxID=325217 RepID=UPI00333A5FAB
MNAPTGRSNRTERRREAAASRRGVKEFENNGRWFPGGPFQATLHVVRREVLPFLIVDAHEGDASSRAVCDAVEAYLRQCNAVEANDPSSRLCLACEETFGIGAPPEAVLVAVPVKMGPVAIGTGVCKACAGRLSNIEIGEAWAKRLKWPGLRITESA